MREDFTSLIPLGTKEDKSSKESNVESIFKTFSLGVGTNRDEWVYDFQKNKLQDKMKEFVRNYNREVFRLSQEAGIDNIDDFVNNDPHLIKWTDRLKTALQKGETLKYEPSKVRNSMYRPFNKQFLYFDHLLNQRRYRQAIIFPNHETEKQNRVICVTQTAERPFCCLIANMIPNLVMCGGFGSATQCFPFYSYDENGLNRQENITDWAQEQFQSHFKDRNITRWDIFHYIIYAVLHHPEYREKYAANLKRELPRIPFASEFLAFARAGAKLAELHVKYEDQAEYPLKYIENKDASLDYRVDKMKLSSDKTQIIFNDFLTLGGIPSEVFDYRLGNRSALEWIIDQYQEKRDKRSGIVNDPNSLDDPQYILRLIGKVVTVSLETVKIVKNLPAMD